MDYLQRLAQGGEDPPESQQQLPSLPRDRVEPAPLVAPTPQGHVNALAPVAPQPVAIAPVPVSPEVQLAIARINRDAAMAKASGLRELVPILVGGFVAVFAAGAVPFAAVKLSQQTPSAQLEQATGNMSQAMTDQQQLIREMVEQNRELANQASKANCKALCF